MKKKKEEERRTKRWAHGRKKKVKPCQWVPQFSTYLQNDHSAMLLKK